MDFSANVLSRIKGKFNGINSIHSHWLVFEIVFKQLSLPKCFFCISSFRRSYFVNLIEKTIENLTKVLNCNVQFEDSECFKSTSAVNSHFNKRQKIRNY